MRSVIALLAILAALAASAAHAPAQDSRPAPRQFDLSPDTVSCIRLDDDGVVPTLTVELTPLGQTIVTAITTERQGESVPLVFEGTVLSRPVIHEPVTGDSLLISAIQSGDWPMDSLSERLGECFPSGEPQP